MWLLPRFSTSKRLLHPLPGDLYVTGILLSRVIASYLAHTLCSPIWMYCEREISHNKIRCWPGGCLLHTLHTWNCPKDYNMDGRGWVCMLKMVKKGALSAIMPHLQTPTLKVTPNRWKKTILKMAKTVEYLFLLVE